MKAKLKAKDVRSRESGRVSASLSRRDVFARIRRSVVAIVNSPAVSPNGAFDLKQIVIAGSGFYVEQDGLVATAGHVVDKWIPAIQAAQATGVNPDMPAVLSHGPVRQAGNDVTWEYFLTPVSGIYRSGVFDLALLSTIPTGEYANAICSVKFSTMPCGEGDHVATCGYPFGVELHAQVLGSVVAITPSFSQGVVSAILPHNAAPPSALKRFQIHAMISGGNSGGPVFDPYTGDVVGLITNSITNATKDVVIRKTPIDVNGAPSGAPIDTTVHLEVPVGLALAEHAHHILSVINEAKIQGARQAGP